MTLSRWILFSSETNLQTSEEDGWVRQFNFRNLENDLERKYSGLIDSRVEWLEKCKSLNIVCLGIN